MEQVLQSFFMSVLGVSSKAALLAVVVGLTCLLLRRWIPATWRHGLWLLVFIRVMIPDLGEFRWALPSWPSQAWTSEVTQALPLETASKAGRTTGVNNIPDSSSQEVMPPIPPEAGMSTPPAVLPSPTVAVTPTSHVPAGPSSQPLPWLIAASLWLTGALAWWTCLFAGWLRFRHRVLRTSTSAPTSAARLLDDARQLAGKSGVVRLRVTDKLHTPAVCGIWKPVILLPAEALTDLPAEKLRLLLLHEIGHTRRMDVLVQVLTSVLLGLHWFNPLLWFAHRQLRAEAEAATDAWVLQHTDSKESRRYGETLIDLAARCSWMGWLFFLAPSVIGAAESSSSLRSRIRAIANYRNSSRWSWLVGLGCVIAMIATGMTQAPQDNGGTESKGTTISKVEPATPPEKQPVPTPTKSTPTAKELTSPGFFIADQNRVVLKAGTSVPMPEPRHDMATDDIGGVVVDEDGNMVANATVQVKLYRRAAGEKNPDSVKSDAQGRWTMKGIAGDRQVTGETPGSTPERAFKVTASHPDYLSLDLYYHTPSFGPKTANFRKGTAVLIMEKGLVMKGRVTDTEGKPVANAMIRRCAQERNVDDPTAMTDADGNYELKHARPGDWRMRIEAKNSAVWMDRVELLQSGTRDFKLDPAKKLTVRVVDTNGKPVPKAYVLLQGPNDEPHGVGSIAWGSADDEGKYSWAWTPPRNVRVRVSHDSYQDAEVRAKPQDTEVIVTLTPRQMIELRIVDAVTGKPVPGCQVLRGEAFRDKDNSRERTAWPGNPARAADAQGVYQEGISDPKELVVYRITAAGYTPLVTRALSPANAVLTETIKLQRAMPLLVRIVQQDGQPAQKANVYAILRANGLVLESVTERRPAEHYENPLEASLSADKDGRCALPSLQDDTVILVVHESGFAYAYWRDVPRGTDWKLGPWARAEATVADGGKPVAGASYTYQGGMVLPGQRWVSMVLKVTSDAQGKIVLPQVFPAMQAHFAENIPVPVDKTGQGRTGRISSVGERMQEYEMKTTRAGETTRFDLRPAAGRTWTVTGRFVMENAADKKEPFPKGFILTKEHANQGSTTGINIAAVNSDGTFEAGPLTAGAYQLGLWDDDKTHFSLKQPALTLPEPPVGATQEQRRRDIGDVVLISLNSPTAKLGAPKGRARFRVMVQDEKGQPVAGARISVAAFRSKEESGVTFALPDTFPDLAGKQVTADASGVAEIECSATSKQGRTLTELQLIVMGDGVVGNFAAFAKANVISTFILKRAGTIVAQIMWQGKTVEGEGVHLLTSKAGSDADAGFTRQADGTYVNRSLRLGPVLVQAAWKTPDGSLVFSDAMPVTVTDGSIVNCTLNLKPGQRLQGRLDAKVPRPVKDARIGACVLHVVQGQNGKISESGARIVWLDRTEVREDGSFEFASLPPGPVHVVVLGDGWISTHRQDAWGIVRPLPLTMPLTGEVVIPMEHTATCEVVVQSSKGEPIQGASVFVSPNLNWDGTGNGLLDLYLPTLQETLSKSLNSKERPSPYQTWRSHHAVTDATGKATLTNLPGGQHYVQVYPKAWKAGSVTQPIAQENSDNIELGKTGRLLIRVKE